MMRQFRQAVRYDLRFGIRRVWWAFLPAVLWGVYVALRVDMARQWGLVMGAVESDAPFSLADVLLYAFGGMGEYIPVPGEPFEIPVEWLLWHVYLALLVSQYTHKNLCGMGQQMLVRFRRRRDWWGGKCVWCAAAVALSYGLLFAAMAAYTACRGALSPTLSPFIGDVVKCPLTPGQLPLGWDGIAWRCALTAAVSLALCQAQNMLVLVLRPLGAFLTAVVFLAAGAYITTPALFGSYAMWERSIGIGMGAFTPLAGVIITLAVCVGSILLGGALFAKYDIIQIQE